MAWLHMHFNSESLRMPVPMEVLLPQHVSGGYRTAKDPGPYQTLYLLHGMSDDHTAWMRRTSVERYIEGLPLAVVMPTGHLGWYADMEFGPDYFSFITEELPAVCERMFPLSHSRDDRFIAGLSMGGYGALKAGLLAPDQYRSAASFSGALDVLDVYERLDERAARDIFGSQEQLKGSRHDLFAAADQLAKGGKPLPDLYMWCGTEDHLYDANTRFRDHVNRLGLPLTYEEGPGDHSWRYWDGCIERVLAWLPLRQAEKS